MVRFWWMFILCAKTASASDNALPGVDPGKESRFLPLFEAKRYDRPPIGPGGLPPLTNVPATGDRCAARLETALDQMQRRNRNQPKNLDTPLSQTLDLNGYSLHKQMRSAPIDMYVTKMRVRLPQNSNWVRVQTCHFDPRNISLDTMLLFNDLTISGIVDLYNTNEIDRGLPPNRLRRNYAGPPYEEPYPSGPYSPDDNYPRRGNAGCNMILRLRKAGIGFHTRPLSQQPGKFNVKTDSEFVEPGFISVYAYGCERYINKNSNWNKNNLPLNRKKRSDQFSFEPHLRPPRDNKDGRSIEDWDVIYEPRSRSNYERSKHYRPEDELDEVEDISREMEDIFTKGIRTLLTTYMKKELQPAIKDTLMRNMGYVISYG